MDSLADLRKLELPFNVDEVDEQCHHCVRAQLEKYNNFIDSEGKTYKGKFCVPCVGIAKPLPDSLKRNYPDDIWDELQAAGNPARWIEKYLKLPDTGKPFITRWYQSAVVNCTSRRRCLRISRRGGKTAVICGDICYRMFTTPGLRILLVGPNKSHVEEILTRVTSMIESNPILATCITRNRSAPYYEISLSNKSKIRGFAIGTDDNKGGTGVKGQDADIIFAEEADSISDFAFKDAVLPILQTHPNTTLIGFSTPLGQKTTFYKMCKEMPVYKEFHHTYKVLPWWETIELEKPNFTEEEWTHNFLAEFGNPEDGVYKTSYIDRALRGYLYNNQIRSPNWRYVMGVDWNEQHGTELVVLGWNPAGGMYTVADAVCISKSEFTQLAGIDAVLKMNKKWRPSFIYIDAGGGGSTNSEVLQKESLKHRHHGGDPETARILDILKKYDSGASIEVRDPIDGQLKRKPAKQFMVNSSVRLFEQGKLLISSSDKILEAQLRGYIIKRISPQGVPVYAPAEPKIGDHRLDALNLAIVGFQINFGDLYNVEMVTTVAGIPGPQTIAKIKVEAKNPDVTDKGSAGDRRLDQENNWSLSHSILPARIGKVEIKSTRPGWSTDEEEKYKVLYQHRKQYKEMLAGRGKPSRTNI